MKSKERALLGVSGGTDSSVAAMRLQDASYEVIGVTFRFYEVDGRTEYLDDAHALAVRLGIEHVIYDTRELFREHVIRYFIDEYLAGHTPILCMLCNNELRWALLTKIINEKGTYWISTGHYARKALLREQRYITPASDRDKNQTFFLWGLKQDILQRMLLLMGDVTKEEVRAYAAGRGFARVASKKDSIGVCFCPLDHRFFLEHKVPAGRLPGKGLFIDEKGGILGNHRGHPSYAIGQRHGLGIYFNRAVFVKEVRTATNEVVLASLASLYKDEVLLKDWNPASEQRVLGMEAVIVKIRYCKQANHYRVALMADECLGVSSLGPLEAIVPGQATAFYDADGLLLGGGITL